MIAIPPHHASARLELLEAAETTRSQSALRRTIAHLALALTILLGLPALAHAGGGVSVSGSSSSSAKAKAKGAQAEDTDAEDAPLADRPKSVNRVQLKRAQTLLRLSPTGTHDVKTRRVVKRFQRLRGIAENGIVDINTYLQIKDAFALLETGGIGVVADDDGTGGVVVGTTPAPVLSLPPNLAPITPQERAILDRIGECESKGDATSLSANGLYRGKYQFDKTTWKTVGGTGDPAAATEEEQDQRAAILLRQRGTAPWPVCSVS